MFENLDSFKGTKNVVINLSTSRMIEDLADEYGIKVHRSAVGEINVVSKMKEVDAVYGGEGSGGVILPESHFGRDSLVGIALLSLLIAQSGKSLSKLATELPKYSISKTKMDFSGDFSNIENVAKDVFRE